MITQDNILKKFEVLKLKSYDLFDESIKPGGLQSVAGKIGPISVKMGSCGIDRRDLMYEICRIIFRSNPEITYEIAEVIGRERPDIILMSYTVDVLRA